MRIVVEGRSVGEGRLALAAAGLAHRGHAVAWADRAAARDTLARLCAGRVPESLHVVPPGLALARVRAEVAIGAGDRPWIPALTGWLAHAHALVLGLAHRRVAGWGLLDRWAWDAARATGLVEPAEAEAFRGRHRGLDLDRLAPWSDAAPPAAADPAHPDVEILERACERALARQRGRAPRPAVFLDRDGTLVVEHGYLDDPARLELLPEAAAAVRRLRAAGYAVVVLSNQSGVGRGMFTLARAHEIMARLRGLLRPGGAEPDAIYLCPHRPEDGCACRKPGTALLERAAEDLVLDLGRSFVIGDKAIDAATGRNAGGRGVLVRTGYGRDEERRLLEGGGTAPDAVCDDLAAAADWVLQHADPSA